MRFEAPKIRDATVDRISKVSLKLDEAKLLVKDNPHDPTILRRLYAIERQYQHREILLKKQDALLTIIEKTPIWSDKLSLSVNLSIKNVASLFDLLDKLEEYHIPHKEYRLPGRYDVNILIEDISGQQAICVLYLIDQQTSSEKDTEKLQAIGNYEVIFLASSWGGKRRLRFIPPSQQEFEKNINNKLLTLLGSINLPQNEFMEYIQETLRATRELTNTGFRYHAMFLNKLMKIRLPMAGSPYASAVRADMSIGDKEFQGPTPYYNLYGKHVREQVKYHSDV